ncbi:hypothetical protein JNM87_06940 [Candidatus Saccharibacteria bacterium]|nr:hypothetical protein [Candidatus Saccharibacteria bacterium]
MKNITHILTNISFVALAVLGTMVFTPALASAADANRQAVCEAIGPVGGGTNCDSASTTGVNSVISTGLNIFATIIGLVAVVMIFISGYKYITSGGDSSKVASAKSTLIYAIVGIVVAALAQVIVKFVLSKAK